MYDASQPSGGALGVVPVERRLVVRGLVAEQLAAPRHQVVAADQLPLEVVADLVPEVTEHRAVGLGELGPDLLAVRGVALGQVDGDHAVVVPDDDVLVDAARAGRRRAVLGVRRPADDRKPEAVELEDQVPLGPLGRREVLQPDGVVVTRPGAGQVARGALPALEGREPGAAGEVEVAADVPDQAGGVDVPPVLVDRARSPARRARTRARCRTRRTPSSRSAGRCRTPGSGRPSRLRPCHVRRRRRPWPPRSPA